MDILTKEKKCAKIANKYKRFGLIASLKLWTTFDSPETKTLSNLWDSYGLPKYKGKLVEKKGELHLESVFKGSDDDRVACLSEWVHVLYGPVIAEKHNLRDILARNYYGLSPYLGERKGGRGVHVYRGEPTDNLIRDLSDTLPHYDDAHSIEMMADELGKD